MKAPPKSFGPGRDRVIGEGSICSKALGRNNLAGINKDKTMFTALHEHHRGRHLTLKLP